MPAINDPSPRTQPLSIQQQQRRQGRLILLLVVCCMLFSFGCMSSTIIMEVTRTEDGQHLLGQSMTIEFDRGVWNALNAEDRAGVSEFSDGFKQQGWKVQTSDGGRVINATKDPVTLETLTQQGWTVNETKLETGRVITATIARMNPFGSTGSGDGGDFLKNVTLIIDESDPNGAKYKYSATVEITIDTTSQESSGTGSSGSIGDSWGDAVNDAIASDPEIQRLEQALKDAGPPKITLGIGLPGPIETATLNGSPGGTILDNSAEWTIVLDKAGTYNLEASARKGAEWELSVYHIGLEGMHESDLEPALYFGESSTVNAQIEGKYKDTGNRVESSMLSKANVEFYYDGNEIGRAETDAKGWARIKFSPPEDTPEGRSNHEFKVVVSKPGVNSVEEKRQAAVVRGVRNIYVWVDSIRGTHAPGSSVTISGKVLGYFSGALDATVTADDFAGHTNSDGDFSIQATVPDSDFSLVGNKWTVPVVAKPTDNRFAAGSSSVDVLVTNKGYLQTTANMDKGAYTSEENATISGIVTAEGQPVQAEVEIIINGIKVGVVSSAADGRYTYMFKPSSVPLAITNPGQVPSGQIRGGASGGGSGIGGKPAVPFIRFPMHVVQAKAMPAQGFLGASGFTYFNVTAENSDCRMENMWVSVLMGNPSVELSPEQKEDLSSLTKGSSLLNLGGAVPQGMRVETSGGDRATFTLLLDREKNLQAVIALGSNTTMDVGLFCRDATGKLHVVLRVNTPGQVMVNWPSGANADLKIYTPRGTVSNIHTQYVVIVDEAGTTSVTTLEGTARLSDEAGASVDIETGKQVTVHEGEATGDAEPVDAEPIESQAQVDPRLIEIFEQEPASVPGGQISGNTSSAASSNSSSAPDYSTYLPWAIAAGVALLLVVVAFAVMRSRSRRVAVASASSPAAYSSINTPPVAPASSTPLPPPPVMQRPPPAPPAYAPPQPPSFIDMVRQADATYARLRQQVAMGQITPQQFEETLRNNRLMDANGYYWMQGVDGLWYVYYQQGYVLGNPYGLSGTGPSPPDTTRRGGM